MQPVAAGVAPPLPLCKDRDDHKFLELAARCGANILGSKDAILTAWTDDAGVSDSEAGGGFSADWVTFLWLIQQVASLRRDRSPALLLPICLKQHLISFS